MEVIVFNSIDTVLNDFQYKNDNIQLWLSICILDECIDVPSCDSIFITYLSQSKIRTIQRLCRCIRIDMKNKHKIGNVYIWCNQLDDLFDKKKEYDSMFRDKIKMSENNFYGEREKWSFVIKDVESIKNYLIDVREFKDLSWMENQIFFVILYYLKAFLKEWALKWKIKVKWQCN